MGGREECSKQSPVGVWSCFPQPILVLWASGTLAGRDRLVAESASPADLLHSPKGPGGATPRLRSLLGLALAMPSASPCPGTAVLLLASRHHSWAGRGGRPARSLQLRREPFPAGATPTPWTFRLHSPLACAPQPPRPGLALAGPLPRGEDGKPFSGQRATAYEVFPACSHSNGLLFSCFLFPHLEPPSSPVSSRRGLGAAAHPPAWGRGHRGGGPWPARVLALQQSVGFGCHPVSLAPFCRHDETHFKFKEYTSVFFFLN